MSKATVNLSQRVDHCIDVENVSNPIDLTLVLVF